jgi:mxaA protein
MRVLAAILMLASAGALAQPAPVQLDHRVDDARAFGWRVGDVVERVVRLQVPPGLRLDEASLPAAGRPGGQIELVRIDREGEPDAREQVLRLRYQVFLAPDRPRALELPPIELRFAGGARPQALRVDAWPLVVAPITQAEPSPRTGLGLLRPDHPAPQIDTRSERVTLAVCAVVAAVLLGWLLLWPLGSAWWLAQHRPFARAERSVRRLLPREGGSPGEIEAACRALHAAFDAQARGVVMAADAVTHARSVRWMAPLADEIARFYTASRTQFFAPSGNERARLDAATLRAFAARLRDAERSGASRRSLQP